MSPPPLHRDGPTQEALFDYLAGRLLPPAAQWVQSHLETCPECGSALERLRAVRTLLQPRADSPLRRQRHLVAMRRKLVDPPRPAFRPLRIVFGVGALVAAALLVGF